MANKKQHGQMFSGRRRSGRPRVGHVAREGVHRAGRGDRLTITSAIPKCCEWAPETAEMIFAGKKAGAHTLTQEEINALLVEKTRAGKQVVRLKGGDPFLFGRGGEEAQALAAAQFAV